MRNNVQAIRAAIETALRRRPSVADGARVTTDYAGGATGWSASATREWGTLYASTTLHADEVDALRALAVIVGLRPDGSDPAEEVGRLTAERDAALAERDDLRAITDGRATPPTDEEIEVHHAAGGAWYGATATGGTWSDDSPAEVCRKRGLNLLIRWWALGADRRPGPWPVVGGAQ